MPYDVSKRSTSSQNFRGTGHAVSIPSSWLPKPPPTPPPPPPPEPEPDPYESTKISGKSTMSAAKQKSYEKMLAALVMEENAIERERERFLRRDDDAIGKLRNKSPAHLSEDHNSQQPFAKHARALRCSLAQRPRRRPRRSGDWPFCESARRAKSGSQTERRSGIAPRCGSDARRTGSRPRSRRRGWRSRRRRCGRRPSARSR